MCTIINIMNRLLGGGKRKIFDFRLKKASPKERAELMRGKFYHIGHDVELYTLSFGTEPYLIWIDDYVCVASHVVFITHDVSCFRMAHFLGVSRDDVDKVGSIHLHRNCFVGASSILMPNTSVGENSVIAAGSVVTKHVPDNEVWGGVPAKYIMKTEDYAKKIYEESKRFSWVSEKETMPLNELIIERQKFFFEDRIE